MIQEKTITINGADVRMRYCAAAETGFEKLAGVSSDIFNPIIQKNDKGDVPDITSKATTDDWIKLGMAAIIAAYSREDKEPPVDPKYIMFDATPDEVRNIIIAVMTLRNSWYGIPDTIEKSEFKEKEGKRVRRGDKKNVPTPTIGTSDS